MRSKLAMNNKLVNPFWAASAVLTAAVFLAGITYGPTKASASASAAQGKTLTTSFGCIGCHGADLKGKMGPSLASTGALKKYNKAKFERAMKLGLDEKGQPLKKPMPTFNMAPAQADAIYAYLKTIK